MNVSVMSRKDAVAYSEQSHDNPVVMISISDPRMRYSSAPRESKQNNIQEILCLKFADADRPGLDVYGRVTQYEDMMQSEDAQAVYNFLKRHEGVDVIVHCDAGISRSAGVAAGILKATTGSDELIFDNRRFCPNIHCYRTVLETFFDNEHDVSVGRKLPDILPDRKPDDLQVVFE